jgi:hypothetical protein
MVEVIFNDALDDLTDGVPGDPQKRGDRGLGHLLRKPRDHVFEVARVMGIVARPRHGLQMHAAIRAAQPAQTALDHAPA